MSRVSVDFGKSLALYIDGIPLDLACRVLPLSSRLHPGLFLHLFIHAKSQKDHAADSATQRAVIKDTSIISKEGLTGLVENLRQTVSSLKWKLPRTEWGNYYSNNNYSDLAMEEKSKIVLEFIKSVKPKMLWDFGANDGRFGKLASGLGINTIAFDVDPVAVEMGYLNSIGGGDTNYLSLLQDLTNPSPSIGFENRERDSLFQRGPADMVLALALVHHLAISNNVSFERLASFFAGCGRNLVIEFVPREDSQVQKLLSSRSGDFPEYTLESFKLAFSALFDIVEYRKVSGSERVLFLMRRRDDVSTI
jgi:hypothetical protein